MIPWTLLDRAPLPNSSDEIRLYQRGTEYSIRVANYELMNSRVHGSEEALADLAFARLDGRSPLRVLIGASGSATRSPLRCAESAPAEKRSSRSSFPQS